MDGPHTSHYPPKWLSRVPVLAVAALNSRVGLGASPTFDNVSDGAMLTGCKLAMTGATRQHRSIGAPEFDADQSAGRTMPETWRQFTIVEFGRNLGMRN